MTQRYRERLRGNALRAPATLPEVSLYSRPGLMADDDFVERLPLAEASPDPEAARLALAQRFSYVVPDRTSLDMLHALGPLIELGAGTGYWAAKLRALGTDIAAFDQAPPDGDTPNRYHAPTATWSDVRQGDERALAEHPDRALFLCWPPLFSSLGDCLRWYSGNTVACIGDGGHRTARLSGLNEGFEVIARHPVQALDPFPGVPPLLSVWNRRATP
jgi:hypothetical protein